MTGTVAKPDPATETYENVENLLNHFVWKFVAKYGGDFDELKSEANVAYMRAYHSFKNGEGCKFSSYVGTCVYRHLLDLSSKKMRGPRLRSLTDKEGYQRDVADDVNDCSYLEELSADARQLVKLVIDTPEDLKEAIVGKGGQPRNYRSAIKMYAYSYLKWEWDRVLAACEEVKVALNHA